MLINIVRPERKLVVKYGLRFYVDKNGGCEFPCDADGNIDVNNMTEAAIKNYSYCLDHPEKFPYAYNKVATYRYWVKDNPYGTCKCGEVVELWNEYMGACQCPKCGKWYNLFGQELLPPSEWGDIDYDY